MFIKAFLTIVAADAVDRHMREQQHRAWVAEQHARAAAHPQRTNATAPVASRPTA